MNLARKYKISKLLNIRLHSKEEETINFIREWVNDLTIYKSETYPTSTYYMNSHGNCVLEDSSSSPFLYVRCEGFWSELENIMREEEIQDIVRIIIEETLQHKIKTPHRNRIIHFIFIESRYKEENNGFKKYQKS